MIWDKVLIAVIIGVSLFEELLGIHVSNLNETCLRCLCHICGCDLAHGCTDGYCGPFYISRLYWIDAGRPTLLEDSPDRKEAYDDCARDYDCSLHIVESYMAKYGQDCNGDGVTDCYDFMMIHHNGGRGCSAPLYMTTLGLRRLHLFQQCRL